MALAQQTRFAPATSERVRRDMVEGLRLMNAGTEKNEEAGDTRREIGEAGLDVLFRGARSYNGYLDRPVDDALLRQIWLLASLGPTSANMSPARIVWCRSRGARERLAKLASAANAKKILQAPVTAIIGMDMKFADKLPFLFPHVDARSWFTGSDEIITVNALRNSTLQGAYLIMAARALGIDTGPMSGFDNEAVDVAFFSGTSVKSNFITTLGYGDPASLFPRLPRLPFEEATWTL
jgi:3-hydroxypropanoate dehydrogenase